MTRNTRDAADNGIPSVLHEIFSIFKFLLQSWRIAAKMETRTE